MTQLLSRERGFNTNAKNSCHDITNWVVMQKSTKHIKVLSRQEIWVATRRQDEGRNVMSRLEKLGRDRKYATCRKVLFRCNILGSRHAKHSQHKSLGRNIKK